MKLAIIKVQCQRVTIRLEGNTCGYASAWGAIFRLGVYDGDRVILTKENGEILSGWQYGNRWFYGEPGTSVMHIGWLKLRSTWYYLSRVERW